MSFEPIDHYDPRTGGHSGLDRRLQQREQLALALIASVLEDERSGTLVDIGCGNGLFLAELERTCSPTTRGWELLGIDYSAAQIELARARGGSLRFEQCNVEEALPFDDGGIDVAFAGELIEHLYDPDAFLAECRRVLPAGGHLILTTPNLHAWYNRVLFPLGAQPIFYETSTRSTHVGSGRLARLKDAAPVGHLRLFSRNALRDLLDREGFAISAVRGAVFPSLPAPVLWVDSLMRFRPSLASNLVVLAERL